MKRRLEAAEQAAQMAEAEARRLSEVAQLLERGAVACRAELEAQKVALAELQADAVGNQKLRSAVDALESQVKELDLSTLQRLSEQEKLHELMRGQVKSILAEPAVNTFYTVCRRLKTREYFDLLLA